MPKHASDIANGIDVEKPPPGLMSVASATGTACSISMRAGAKRPSFGEERSRRQQRRDDAVLGQRCRTRLVNEDQMIRGARADVGGDARAAAQRELVGMNARLQAVREAGQQDARATRPA